MILGVGPSLPLFPPHPSHPCVGFFYSGLLRRKNTLSMIGLSDMLAPFRPAEDRAAFSPPSSSSLTSYPQWFFWGLSLAFSETSSPYFGNLSE
ncbi:hypothetical protein JB92DRAFT_2907263 [Gautieria morchelliformis]|nr:hypothetical protein JB92DRAFT_2907263 [Gautieria morchelliformis]